MRGTRLVLFALTGFGNAVYERLHLAGVDVELVVTRREPGPYPYHETEDIVTTVERCGGKVAFGAAGESLCRELRPDIILAATYHRILPAEVLSSAKLAFNLHPSLLPRYRGGSPCYWVIKNGEAETGVTAHILSPDVDGGDILGQRRYQIAPGETQGSLRQALRPLAAELALEVVQDWRDGRLQSRKQDESEASYFPRFHESERRLTEESLVARERHRRALEPWPGPIELEA